MIKYATRASFVTSLSALCLGAVLLVGCATPTVTPPSEEEKNALAEASLASAVYTETLLGRCERVGPDLKSLARDLRLMWMTEHGDLLAGADTQYSLSLANETLDYSGHAMALSAVRFLHHHQSRAEKTLRLHERSPENRRLVCERELNNVERELNQPLVEQDDTERAALIRRILIAQAERPVTLEDVPTLALQIPGQQPPGRSYRALESRWLSECEDGMLLVIANEWPHEAYGAFCDSSETGAPSGPRFVTCEWGECDSL
ncbi:hypothetical protein [Marinimicrobium sp. ARAG 43.8]|uniref:hypothetical protein n=1 Tax=Marinimicrobium sp. ARAG 43.8 TaxID=3418719 RepID=UPI003CF2A748